MTTYDDLFVCNSLFELVEICGGFTVIIIVSPRSFYPVIKCFNSLYAKGFIFKEKNILLLIDSSLKFYYEIFKNVILVNFA